MNLTRRRRSSRIGSVLAVGGVALAALALANYVMARRTEQRHPPKGTFIEVNGVRLHYRDRGKGGAVVLIHGNMVTGEDYDTSGVAEILLETHRVIIFDRPGFGHSERPHDRIWTAGQQADLLHRALQQLGVVRPVVVGHSWGAIVAMAMAVRHEADTAGVVALSGYYFWTLRPDVLLVGVGALPVVGDILRYTISPVLNWLTMPLVKRALFSPGPVPKRFKEEFSTAMAVRPSQIRATAEDGALMIPGALALRDHYKDLTLPVVIIAGEGDKVVFKRRAEQLKAVVKESMLYVVHGAGHMIHYQAPRQVAEAVEAVVQRSSRAQASVKLLLFDDQARRAAPRRAAPRVVLRMAAGRKADPTAAIIDNRILHSAPETGPRAGYEGAKRKRGSTIHVAVDKLGHLLALYVTAVDVGDRVAFPLWLPSMI